MGLTGMGKRNETKYLYRWSNNEKRRQMKGRECIVIVRGRANSALIEFTDNKQREIISRNAIRKKYLYSDTCFMLYSI